MSEVSFDSDSIAIHVTGDTFPGFGSLQPRWRLTAMAAACIFGQRGQQSTAYRSYTIVETSTVVVPVSQYESQGETATYRIHQFLGDARF